MPRWHVRHKNLDGSNIAQFSIENLHVTWNKGENGPHELTYEIPSQYPGTDISRIKPYYVDFELARNDIPLFSGMLTSVSFESENEYIEVAGKSYLHYLDKRTFPFDPMDPNRYRIFFPPRGYAFDTVATEMSTIIGYMFDKVFAEPNSLPMTWELVDTGVFIPYQIDLGDTETILSKITALSQQDPGNFDFWIDDLNKHFKMAVPRRYPIDVLADPKLCNWTFTDSPSGLLSVKWTNNGPESSRLTGYGAGDDVKLGLRMQDPGTMNMCRLLEATEDFGDVPNRARVNALTKGKFGYDIRDQTECTIEVWPDAVQDFFYGRIYPGCAIWLDYSNEVYRINSAHEVVSIELEVNTETDESVTLNLNQVYPLYEESAPPVIPTIDPEKDRTYIIPNIPVGYAVMG